jgi:hypothetical protein
LKILPRFVGRPKKAAVGVRKVEGFLQPWEKLPMIKIFSQMAYRIKQGRKQLSQGKSGKELP